MEEPELVQAVKAVERNAMYARLRGRLHSKTPDDVWSEAEGEAVIVTFETDPTGSDTFQGVLAFTVVDAEVRDVAVLSLGFGAAGWHVVNSGADA